MSHLVTLPILLPLAAAIALLLIPASRQRLQRGVSVAASTALLAVVAVLLARAWQGELVVYRVGDWPMPFGIPLVLDRLAALMLALTAVVAFASLLHALQGADAEGSRFHPLFHLQLVGLNGAFLTGDIFNLFVFFEILLIASYCLLVHGGQRERLTSGLHYVVLNLAGSGLFLIAVGALYGVAGSLNMADLAVRVAALSPADAALVRAAALLLLVVFALKAALVPLHLWLPPAYDAAAAPVAALFAIMTKVGVYAIARVFTLVFGPDAGVAAGVATPWLLPFALATIIAGMMGAVASRGLRRMQGYLLIGSVGIMLAAISLFTARAVAAGLYYLIHSTLTVAAMFLIADLVVRARASGDDRLDRASHVASPGLLGAMFLTAGVAAVGLPPLSGFLGKAMILQASDLDARGVWLWAVVLGGSLIALVALARAGSALFWQDGDRMREAAGARRLPPAASLPALLLLAVLLAVTLLAGPLLDLTAAAADSLLDPRAYVDAVLTGVPR